MAFERRILTRFDADTTRHDRGTRRMQDQFRRLDRTSQNRLAALDRRFQRSARSVQVLTRAMAGLVAVLGVRRLAQGVERAVDSLDNIAKSADAIGVTTDALQELRVAADLSGVSADQLDTSLRRFARTTSDAREGLATAKRGFDELGISVTDSDGKLKEIDVLLAEVADGFAGMDDATRKAALAQELFGRSGTAMVNMLNQGSAGIDEMRRKARELGIVIEEDLIRESVRLRDELTLLQRQLDTDMTEAMVRLGPVIRDLGNLLVWLSERAAQAHEGFRRLFSGELRQTIADIGIRDELEAARAELDALDAEFRKLTETGQSELGARLGIFPEEGEDEDQRLDRFNETLDAFSERRAELVARIEDLQTRLGRVLGEAGGAEDVAPDVPAAPPLPEAPGGGPLSAESTRERESALAAELRVLAERTAELRRMTEAQAALDPEMEGYQTALRAAEIEARLLAKAEAEGVEVKGELAERIREVARAYAEAEGAADQLRERQTEVGEGRRIIDDLAFGLENAITQAKTLEEALQNVAIALANIAIQELQQPGGGFLGSIFSGIFSGSAAPSTSPIPIPRPVAHRGGVIGRDSFPTRAVPDFVFASAPRMHSGAIAGLAPNEVPAILEKGEIVVPKNIGMGRGGGSVTVEGSTIVLQDSQATPEELQRILDRRDRELVGKIQQLWIGDPEAFPQS